MKFDRQPHLRLSLCPHAAQFCHENGLHRFGRRRCATVTLRGRSFAVSHWRHTASSQASKGQEKSPKPTTKPSARLTRSQSKFRAPKANAMRQSSTTNRKTSPQSNPSYGQTSWGHGRILHFDSCPHLAEGLCGSSPTTHTKPAGFDF